MTPEQILDGAIDVIHDRGWCRGAFSDSQGRVCLLGALSLTGNEQQFPPAVTNALAEVLASRFPRVHTYRPASSEIAWFNDHYLSDADEAVECLKLARERLAS